MAKVVRKKDERVFGVSAAANYLDCSESTVLRHADAGRLPHTRDSSRKRLFAISDLEKFKQTHPICNQRITVQDVRAVRGAS